MKIYCYSGCSTCRKAINYLNSKKIPHDVLPIRETPPTKDELQIMLEAYEGNLRKLFNTAGKDYREMKVKDLLPGLSKEAAFELLVKNGNLVKRPFLLGDGIAKVGFKEEEWDQALS